MKSATDKDIATACAIAAWHGILAQPSRDDQGRRTIILTSGAWTKEITPNELQAALTEHRQFQRDRMVAA